jgi:hypothetical protein
VWQLAVKGRRRTNLIDPQQNKRRDANLLAVYGGKIKIV